MSINRGRLAVSQRKMLGNLRIVRLEMSKADRKGKVTDRTIEMMDRTVKVVDRIIEMMDRTVKMMDRIIETVDRTDKVMDRTSTKFM